MTLLTLYSVVPAMAQEAPAANADEVGLLTSTTPKATAITPKTNRESASTTVTITGVNFAATTTVTIGGKSVTTTQANSATSIVGTLNALAAADKALAGVAQKVGVNGTDGTVTFTWSKPTLSSVTPAKGPRKGTTTVTVKGKGLNEISSVAFGTANTDSTPTKAADGLSLTAVAGPATGSGKVDVTIDDGVNTVSKTGAFTFLAPTISSVTPNKGPEAGTTKVTIKGTNLQFVSIVSVGGHGALNATPATDGKSVTAEVQAGTGAGKVDVAVDDGLGASGSMIKANAFTYVAPKISSLTPNKGPEAGTTAVTIKGTNLQFVTGVKVAGKAANSVIAATDGKSVTAEVQAGTGAGKVDVTVDDGVDSQTGNTLSSKTGGFTYVAPKISSVTPNKGPENSTQTVTIKGTNLQFVTGVKVNGVSTGAVTQVGTDGKAITTTVPAGTGAGKVGISVDDGVDSLTGQTLVSKANAYTYVAPTISSVTPSKSYVAASQTITIKGTNLENITSVKVNGVSSLNGITQVGTDGKTITTTAPAGTTTGKVDVSVSDGGSFTAVTKSKGYEYDAPVLTAITPTGAKAGSTTTFTVTGKGLTEVDKVEFAGDNITTGIAHTGDTQLTFSYPGDKSAGAQTVTVDYSATLLGSGASDVKSNSKSYTLK